MRPALFLVPVLAASAFVLSGCGYAGEPKPPALRRPLKAADLAAVERGAKIIVTFTLPDETTEGLPISTPPDIELRIGVAPSPWNQDAWEASATRVPVPAWHPAARGASGATARGGIRKLLPGGAKSTSGAQAAKGASGATGGSGAKKRAAKRVVPVTTTANKALLDRTIEIDASNYTGKLTAIGVVVHGPQGRNDGWSIVSLEVLPPLPVPRDLQPSNAPDAVHLQWAADAPDYRIFRKRPDDIDWTLLGESTVASFDDKAADYGKPWQYHVQSVRKIGDNWMESDPSETITFTPKDTFPPAAPAGLVVISGTRTVELSWDRVADADLAGYRVYRDGRKIADGLLSADYSDKDVVSGAKYSYQVSAVDQAGNESVKSAAQETVVE